MINKRREIEQSSSRGRVKSRFGSSSKRVGLPSVEISFATNRPQWGNCPMEPEYTESIEL